MKARTDLTLASVILEQGPDMDPWVCCFHAQQAAEKALKAVLAQAKEPPFIHNLVALQALLPGDFDLGTPVAGLAELSASARGTRYVTDADGTEDPSWDEASRAVVVAGRIVAAVRAYLGEPG
jgi:HEPN domain-containing protein